MSSLADALAAAVRRFREALAALRRLLADPRGYLRELRVRYRRHRLVMAYAKVGRVQYDLGPGFSPLMYAYGRLDEEGLATLTENGLEWHWPETPTRGGA